MQTHHLLEQIAAPENLIQAWRGVRGNIPKYRRARARGPDGVTMIEFEQDLQAQLAALRDMLLAEGTAFPRYQPQPPKTFRIRKKSGGERELVILSVVDRVAQRAATQILEPLWEPEFLPCSFGFRPGRSVDQALAVAQRMRARGQGWVVDGDIEACFASLDHDFLEKRLQRKIQDRRVMTLLQKWLDVRVLQAGLPLETDDSFADWLKSFQKTVQRGLDWALASASAQDDPYAAARYEEALRETEWEKGTEGSSPPLAPDREATMAQMRRTALRRIALNGLIFGTSLAKDAVTRLAVKASEVLKTPQGRRLLKKSALATGGLAGAAGAAALAAYLLQRKAGPAPTGVLQGSPLSPLLANVYLHPFDVRLTKQRHRLIRFADDWVILAPDQDAAGRAYNDALETLARMQLRLNTEKTHIRKPGETFEWLGGVIK